MTRQTHLPCERCGSSDAMTRYANGEHCFSCGSHKNYLNKESLFNTEVSGNKNSGLPILTSELPKDALQWLLKAYIFKDDILKSGIKYNQADERIMLPLPGEGNYQGRSLDKYRAKYKTYGEPSFPVFGESKDLLIIVEDWLSAYRIGKHATAICTLGTKPNIDKLVAEIGRIRPKSLVIWYDSDYPGRKAALALQGLLELHTGQPIKDFYTEKDPKHLGLTELIDIIGALYDNRIVLDQSLPQTRKL